jgi:hypothetical protein
MVRTILNKTYQLLERMPGLNNIFGLFRIIFIPAPFLIFWHCILSNPNHKPLTSELNELKSIYGSIQHELNIMNLKMNLVNKCYNFNNIRHN